MPVSTMNAGTEKRAMRSTPAYGDAGPHADEWMRITPTAATTRSASLPASRGRGVAEETLVTSGAAAAVLAVPSAAARSPRRLRQPGDVRHGWDQDVPASGAPPAPGRAA